MADDLIWRPAFWECGRIIHETRIALCWGKNAVGVRDPWPALSDKLPGDFGYEPVPWVDIAWAQARAIVNALGVHVEFARKAIDR